MPLLRLLLPFLIFSFIACSSGPKLTVFISDPAKGGMEWSNKATRKSGFVPYSATDKFVCLMPSDLAALIDYCVANHPKTKPTPTSYPISVEEILSEGIFSLGPQVTVYVSDPYEAGMEFFDQITQKGGFLAYSFTDKFECLNPNDEQTLLTYCGIGN